MTLQKYLLCSSFAGADYSAGISEGSLVYQTFLAGNPVQIQTLMEFADNRNYSEVCIHFALDCCDCRVVFHTEHLVVYHSLCSHAALHYISPYKMMKMKTGVASAGGN